MVLWVADKPRSPEMISNASEGPIECWRAPPVRNRSDAQQTTYEVWEEETHNGWVAAFWKICVSSLKAFFLHFLWGFGHPSWIEHPKKQTSLLMIIKAPNGKCTHHNINTALFSRTTPTGARTRADVRTKTSQFMTRASRKRQANNTRRMRSMFFFVLQFTLWVSFHWSQYCNFRISSDLRLAVLQGLGKDLRGWKVEIGVSSWLRPRFHEDRLDFTRRNVLPNFWFVLQNWVGDEVMARQSWKSCQFLSSEKKVMVGLFFFWGGAELMVRILLEVGGPFKSHACCWCFRNLPSSSWYGESYTVTRVL